MAKKSATSVPVKRNASEGRLNGRLNPGSEEVIVRCYRQGLGDCFLLAFGNEDDQPVYVLIDCGVHSRQHEGPARLKQVMTDIVMATGGALNVVVATHEHADHLSGFVQKGSPFLTQGIKRIDAAWLAWTEKRGDGQADQLREKRGTALRTIEKSLKELMRNPGLGDAIRADQLRDWLTFISPADGDVDRTSALSQIKNRTGSTNTTLLGAAGGNGADSRASSNELAIQLLKSRAGSTKYAEPGDTLAIPEIPNVRAYVLGPPRYEKLLKKDLPGKIRGSDAHKEVYLASGAAMRSLQLSPRLASDELDGYVPDDLRYPFRERFRRTFEPGNNGALTFDWDANEPRARRTKQFFESTYGDRLSSWRRIDNDWLGSADHLALSLDSDTNNTSLALAFELGEPGHGPILLFPADAQVGNWLSWTEQDYGAKKAKFDVEDILRRTVLYKVGHHGSHNATLCRNSLKVTDSEPNGIPYGLELMRDIIAVIPVDRAAAERPMPNPWNMPYEPLYKRLREKAHLRVLRSDLNRLDPLSASRNEADIVPTTCEWADAPGLPRVQWRCAKERFAHGIDGPIWYDIKFRY